MTQEDKELLLKDLSARLPYGVCVEMDCKFIENGRHTVRLCEVNASGILKNIEALNVKPYLRPLSSMTDEEWEDYQKLKMSDWVTGDINGTFINAGTIVDWLNAHHFDYRKSYEPDKKEWITMIKKGLSIEVTKENNPYKN